MRLFSTSCVHVCVPYTGSGAPLLGQPSTSGEDAERRHPAGATGAPDLVSAAGRPVQTDTGAAQPLTTDRPLSLAVYQL